MILRPHLPAATMDKWIGQLQEPHRHYHTLTHIQHMLSNWDHDLWTSMVASVSTREMIAAIWLHDIVYDPTRTDNEERSAEQAMDDLAGTSINGDIVAMLILGTKSHAPSAPPQNFLNDLDMLILAEERTLYEGYARGVRKEYAFVPHELYREKRIEFLNRTMATPIFHSHPFRRYVVAAHRNMRWEIDIWNKLGFLEHDGFND